MNILGSLVQHKQQAIDERRAAIYKSLIHWEGQVGGRLFGPIGEGGRREFFCLDENTWVWHEEWTDNAGRHSMTTRYDIRPNVIVKSQGANNYEVLSDDELRNFLTAVLMYREKVVPELRRMANIGK